MSDVKLGARTVTVRELTVAEIRTWLQTLDSKNADSFDLVNAMLFEDCDIDTLLEMTSLQPADVADMLPSELRELVKHCQQVNAHFFSMAQRMGRLMTAVSTTPPGDESASSNITAPPS